MNEINKNLIDERLDLKLTQQEVAVLLGVTRVTYAKWESDVSKMPIGKYEQVKREFERLRQLRENGR